MFQSIGIALDKKWLYWESETFTTFEGNVVLLQLDLLIVRVGGSCIVLVLIGIFKIDSIRLTINQRFIFNSSQSISNLQSSIITHPSFIVHHMNILSSPNSNSNSINNRYQHPHHHLNHLNHHPPHHHSPSNSSDHQISSIYQNYHDSNSSFQSSLNEQAHQQQGEDDDQESQLERSRQFSFVKGDDANGLPSRPPSQTIDVLDELNLMLGEAITSTHVEFQSNNLSKSPTSPNSIKFPSQKSQSLKLDQDPLDYKDELTSLISSPSEYSDLIKEFDQQDLDHQPGSPKPLSDHSNNHLSINLPTQNSRDSARFQDNLSISSSSEEVLSTTAIEESNLASCFAIPIDQNRPTQSPNTPHSIKSYPQQITHELINIIDHSIPTNHEPTTSCDQLQNVISIRKKLVKDQNSKISRTESHERSKALTARSPIVKRLSLDMNFLEQWQWLESQHPDAQSNNPIKTWSLHRIKLLEELNQHFKSQNAKNEITFKMNLLYQRQLNLFEHPHRSLSARLTRQPKSSGGTWCDSVPIINPKELKKVKSTIERCKIYQNKIRQLNSQQTGIDLWIWLKNQQAQTHPSTFSPSFNLSSKPASMHPFSSSSPKKFISHPLSPTSSSHPQHHHLQTCQSYTHLKDSSIGSFPRRASAHKAIQIQAKDDDQQLEMIPSEGIGHRPNGMMANSLMQVKNLPYPGLYSHSIPAQSSFSNLNSRYYNSVPSLNRTSQEPTKFNSFFSQIGRRSSIKHRNNSLNNLSSPWPSSNINLVISPPIMSLPPPGPKGPRPESSKIKLKSSLDELENLNYRQIQLNRGLSGSAPPIEVNQKQIQDQALIQQEKYHRKSYAYGTIHSHQQPLMSNSNFKRSLTTIDNDYDSEELEFENEIKIKIEKLLNILPQAKFQDLKKLLIEHNHDEVATIGAYLELQKNS
ncbi:hypothetical protein O181_024326 [Austropuccinia psidii MF-1]|uniref:Uncharacterized protein n=1 Tax=Austropuccinia psidii MF-1 TaxID=1389203 RepID=A0A9Q3CL88_9BASI|nr:hypothetical protein [Austropuccinia psidii MF-1]